MPTDGLRTADLRERTGGGPVGGLGFSTGGFHTLLQATTGHE